MSKWICALLLLIAPAHASTPGWFLAAPIQLLAFPYVDRVTSGYRYLCYRNPQNSAQWAGLKFNATKRVSELTLMGVLANANDNWTVADNQICKSAPGCKACHQ